MVNFIGLGVTIAVFAAITLVANKFLFAKTFDLTETVTNMVIVVVGLFVAGMVASKLPIKGVDIVSLK